MRSALKETGFEELRTPRWLFWAPQPLHADVEPTRVEGGALARCPRCSLSPAALESGPGAHDSRVAPQGLEPQARMGPEPTGLGGS